MAVRDESLPENDELDSPNDTPTTKTIEEENAYRWRVYRQGRGRYVYAEPGETKAGTFRLACCSREAARNACRQLQRDDRFGPRRAVDPTDPPPPAPARAYDRVSRAEAALAGLKKPPRRGSLTHYPCGHPRTTENTYGHVKGQITCRTCAKAKALARYHDRPRFKQRNPKPSPPKGETT